MRQQTESSGELKDLTEYTGIVSIGGDGVVHEIMQGIHSRPDGRDLLKRLKFGTIGAGSSNGLSASLAHASEVCIIRAVYFFIHKFLIAKTSFSNSNFVSCLPTIYRNIILH